MKIDLPEIGPEQRTPLIESLLAVIVQLQQRVQQLEEALQQSHDDNARLKGLKPQPQIAPSRLETPPPQARPEGQKRAGSEKRSKNTYLVIHKEVTLDIAEPPQGAVFNRYEQYVVQELKIGCETTCYRRARYVLPDGSSLLAPLPADVVPGSHFGPNLISYILCRYHQCHVTQPLLLEQLRDFNIDISAGQINNILTENKDVFHQEKAEVLTAGLATSIYVGVDDTGARHQGHNGYCTAIGNDLFAYFESTDSKSRINFLTVLRGAHTDYAINEAALSYWEQQKLPRHVVQKLSQGPQYFADEAAWQARLQELDITAQWHLRLATEGALMGSLIEHGVSTQLTVLSDGAPQFDLFVHASCWIHAERPLARMVPYNEQHREVIENVRNSIWTLYQDLKAYQQQPDPSRKDALESRFDALCDQKTKYSNIDSVLKEMRDHKSDLLRVLERPNVPLHNNAMESDIREYVKKRKISGGTRSDEGRRCRDTFTTLKKTCRKLGVKFWDYLQDRVRGIGTVPRLAELIRQRATEDTARIGEAVPA